MDSAFRVYSANQGYFSESIAATDIKSSSHARKLAPFVDDNNQLVYWVRWGKRKADGKTIRAHFRSYPKHTTHSLKKQLHDEISSRQSESSESSKHKAAKLAVQAVLQALIDSGKHLPWSIIDPEISDFPMTGDLLANVASIEVEHSLKTPFDNQEYRLDVAILGRTIKNHPIVLAGIEIEFTHTFDFSKALICKSLGFPLVSLNITELEESEITLEWAKKALMETTHNSSDGLRRNYFYIHPLLSTVYLDLPKNPHYESRHQYVIFCPQEDELYKWIILLRSELDLTDKVDIHPVKAKNSQLKTQVENAGELAGEEWSDHNPNGYIQLSIDKPIGKCGDLYLYHLILAKLCNSVFDCLVGYKYETGERHYKGDPPMWKLPKFDKNRKLVFKKNLAPKRVSEPVRQILSKVDDLNR
ncbi:MAG: hypothetical protein U9N57_07225 [Pseudomonadota bacterium]|nr:hypothetical protein [Pseudomonadota bacterium]